MCEFEKKVKDKLEDILKASGVKKAAADGEVNVGVAVSGGADSIALLLALSEAFPLYVITVNHNIRPAEESGGDADFVLKVCEELRLKGRNVSCEVVELEKGEVDRTADSRGGGIEEAARFLRYEAFEKFAACHRLNVLCTAHTQNDQLETVLMRFLQGSPAEAAAGIRGWREINGNSNAGIYARPLLCVTRTEIEEYVASRGFGWRTDKTNYETEYLRNRIRHKLVPLLEEQFPGWQRAVLSGAEKAGEDASFIQSYLEKIPFVPGDAIPLEDFSAYPKAIQRRLLLSACNKAGETARIPNAFIKEILGADGDFSKRFGSIEISRKNKQLFIKKYTESNTDLVFSDIIEETGTFEFPFGNLVVFNYKEQNGKGYVTVQAGESSLAENIPLPFCVRNARPGDTVLCADGSEKKVSDVYSDWHVALEKRSLVPVIQLLDENPQRIKALLAGFLGYKDWIVKL